MKTFKDVLIEHLAKNNEIWNDVEYISHPELDFNQILDMNMNDLLRSSDINLSKFILWTKYHIYFIIDSEDIYYIKSHTKFHDDDAIRL